MTLCDVERNMARPESSSPAGRQLFAVLVIFLIASNYQFLLMSALGGVRQGPGFFSLEAAASLLLIASAIRIASLSRTAFRPEGAVLAASIFIILFGAYDIVVQTLMATEDFSRSAFAYVGSAAVFFSAIVLGRNFAKDFARLMPLWAWIFPISTCLFMLFFAMTGKLEYPWGFIRPQVVSGLKSTEISLSLGTQIIYCFFALRVVGPRMLRLATWLAVIAGMAMLLWLASVSAIFWVIVGAMFCAVVGDNRAAKRLVWITAGIGLVFYAIYELIISQGFIKSTALMAYTQMSFEGRGISYSYLWDLALQRPFTGIGAGRFYLPPHHNILGLACEMGLVSASLYVLQWLAIAWASIRFFGFRSRIPAELGVFGFLAIACYWYLQCKGLTEDTRQLKELYFWGGMILGIYSAYGQTMPQQLAAADNRNRT